MVDIHVVGILVGGTLVEGILVLEGSLAVGIPQVPEGSHVVGMPQAPEGSQSAVLVDIQPLHVPCLKEILCHGTHAHRACPFHLPLFLLRWFLPNGNKNC